MSDSFVSVEGGIGFCGLLSIVFIVLKLTWVIAWSWLWVLAPIWIPASLSLLIYVPYVVLLIKVRKEMKKFKEDR